MTSMPTLILVHGAFHRRTTWNLVLAKLADLDVRAVPLPSYACAPESTARMLREELGTAARG